MQQYCGEGGIWVLGANVDVENTSTGHTYGDVACFHRSTQGETFGMV